MRDELDFSLGPDGHDDSAWGRPIGDSEKPAITIRAGSRSRATNLADSDDAATSVSAAALDALDAEILALEPIPDAEIPPPCPRCNRLVFWWDWTDLPEQASIPRCGYCDPPAADLLKSLQQKLRIVEKTQRIRRNSRRRTDPDIAHATERLRGGLVASIAGCQAILALKGMLTNGAAPMKSTPKPAGGLPKGPQPLSQPNTVELSRNPASTPHCEPDAASATPQASPRVVARPKTSKDTSSLFVPR